MTYSSEVLADSPTYYFRLGEASGTTMVDSSGGGNDGTYNNSPTLGTAGLLVGDSNTAVTWNGTNQSGSRASTNASTFTIEALIKPAVVSGTRVIASRQESGTGHRTWTFRLEGTTLKFYYWNATDSLQAAVVASTTFAVGSTYHVAAVFTASANVYLYVNGSQVGTAATGTMAAPTLTNFRVAASGAGEYFSGVIDEVAFYTTALSATRIAAHHAASTGISGTLAAALPHPTASLSGTYTPPTRTGALAATLPHPLTAALSGTYAPPSIGTLSATLPKVTTALDGTYTPPATPAASLDAVLPFPTVAFIGSYAPPLRTGTLAATLPKITADLAGTYAPLAETGTLTAVLPKLTAALVGTYDGAIPTDLSNALDGLDLLLTATVTFAPAVVAPPAPLGVKYDKAIAYPVPVMVNGRPT